MDTLVLNADASPLTVLPISTENWQNAVKAMWAEDVDVLHSYENWIVRSPSIELFVPAVIMLRKYIRVAKDVKFSKSNVYLRDDYTCQYCGLKAHHNHSLLTYEHVIPRFHGGKTTWTNIASACHKCNHEKGHSLTYKKPNIVPVKPNYFKLAEKAKQKPVTIPHASWEQYLGWHGEITVVEKEATVVELPKR